jgi:glycosyltransferase involved in cell wall biosynthesis
MENADLIESGELEFPVAGIEVMQYLQICDLGLLLTDSKLHEEGCSNTIMEYMAASLPVIATDSGGNKELIEDGVSGFIIPTNDINILVDKVDWIYEHPIEARKMGENGKNILIQNFTTEKMVHDTTDLYKKLLTEKRPGFRE